jgi:hypothetical protein
MNELEQEQQVITEYLLGGLDEETKQQVEERVITDRKYKEEVLMVEDELVEDYLAGRLPEIERDRFRRHYLSGPSQRQKLRVEQALNKYIAENSWRSSILERLKDWFPALLNLFRSQSRLVQFSSVITATAILLGGSWLVYQALSAASERTRLGQELARLNAPNNISTSPDPSVLAVTLPSLQFREGESDESDRIVIRPGTKILQLHVPLGSDDHESYGVVLRLNEGRELFKFNDLKTRTIDEKRTLTLQIPTRILSTNDYVLTVRKLNPDGTSKDVGDYDLHLTIQQ